MEENPISFGEWLTRRRKSLNLTREALAKRVPCSVSTLRRLEADDLRASVGLAELLARVLNIPTDQRTAFIAFARGESAELHLDQAVPIIGQAVSHLPAPLTRLVGRRREIAAIVEALRKPGVRLLTLTGPPGTGKTRLSVAVAQKLAGSFRDGVHFVPLAPVADPEAIPLAIAQVLGVKETGERLKDAVAGFLFDKHLLLVFDNFEHLIPAAAQISDLLNAAPQVKALVTSRETLHLYGEHEFPVPALELLDVQHLPTTQSLALYSRYSSIQFFKERAYAAKSDFRLTSENAADVAHICAWLDGLPLAIEIAAAQIKWHSPAQLYAQLRDRLEALTGGPRDLTPRQQSLRGAVDWSYDLLDETEKRLLSVLGVFSDGCTEDAICSARVLVFDGTLPEADQIEILKTKMRNLVEKSLLRHELGAEDPARYTMLETLHDYARERLAASGMLEDAQEWHCQYYLNFAKAVKLQLLQGGKQAFWLTRMEYEHNNLRGALAWAIATPERVATAMELGWAMDLFWRVRGYFDEQRRWLDQILACDPTPTIMRAKLLLQASNCAGNQADLERARALAVQGMALAEELGDRADVYVAMDMLAMIEGMREDYAQAAELLEQVLSYRREISDTAPLIITLNNLALATCRLGNFERAKQLFAESIETARGAGILVSLGHALHGLAEVHMSLKQYSEAARLLRESISVRLQLGDLKGLANSFESLGLVLRALGNGILPVQLVSTSKRIYKDIGVARTGSSVTGRDELIAGLRIELGEAAFEHAWLSGQSMTTEQAVALALQE